MVAIKARHASVSDGAWRANDMTNAELQGIGKMAGLHMTDLP